MPTTIAADPKKAIPAIPPLNWRREVPLYRISRDTKPAPKERFRLEPPFAQQSDAEIWQYGERVHKAGEVIQTTCWPNAGSMVPLNYSAAQVLEFFTTRQKSRMQRAPWRDGQIFLDDGLSNPLPKIAAPKVQPMDLRPAS